MIALSPRDLRPTSRFLLPGAFVAIVALFVISDVGALYVVHALQRENQRIVRNMLASIERVTTLRYDIGRKRILVGEHIFEHEAVDMRRVERELASVEADYAATARGYEPLVLLSGEREVWEALKSAVAGLEAPLQQA